MVIRARCLTLIASTALLLPLAACDPPAGVDDPGRLQAEGVLAYARVQAVTTPLMAHAYTDLAGLAPDPACGEPPRLLNTQVGEGEGTHLGHFSVTFTTDSYVDQALNRTYHHWSGWLTLRPGR